MPPKFAAGDVVAFENMHDQLRGVLVAPHADASRPDMEETWTVHATHIGVVPDGNGGGRTANGRDAANPDLKLDWVALVNADGSAVEIPGCTSIGAKFIPDANLWVKIPFRVRARRMAAVLASV